VQGRQRTPKLFNKSMWTRRETMDKAGTTMSCGLQVAGRSLSRIDETATTTHKYAGDGDTADWMVDGSTTTRYVGGAGGLSVAEVVGGATTWVLPAPHGEVWTHTDSTGTVTATFGYDEYGVTLQAPSGTQGVDRYGLLGKQQRETDPTTGLILMGVRVYDPALGRFLSVDPVHGDNATAYDYVYGDPINSFALDGRACRGPKWLKTACRHVTTSGSVCLFFVCGNATYSATDNRLRYGWSWGFGLGGSVGVNYSSRPPSQWKKRSFCASYAGKGGATGCVGGGVSIGPSAGLMGAVYSIKETGSIKFGRSR
jgi:RHS repeat-associated protein